MRGQQAAGAQPVLRKNKTDTGSAAQKNKTDLAAQLPRVKPVLPQQALSTFTVQKGFRLELVAAEPMVGDPVDACFDENGRMYVAEMHGYPYSQEPTRLNPKGGGKRNAGVIRLLEDTNGDGRMDKSVKFATGITWPTSVCCYRGGVFVLAPPSIHYFKDTNGDGKADVHKIVFTGFQRSNVQAIANNMKWTLDNRIALAGGRNGGTITAKGKPVIRLGRVDMVFDPETMAVEPLTGGVQFGHSFDNWGNRFVCSNSDHIQQVVFPDRYLRRNKSLAVPGAIRGIARGGPAAPVFRKSPAEPWRVVRTRRRVADPKMRARLSRTEQFAIGFFTSATGVTIYRGAAYPREFQGNAFIGDVGGNLIHRKTMTPRRAVFSAARADRNVEFIASTDNWFRPVNFVNAPDGTLYILDMYRETIEHPYSIPADIKRYVDLQSGFDRGRIYRLVSPGMKHFPRKKLGELTGLQLVAELESPNSWSRITAQRLLWERRDKSVVSLLRQLVKSSKSPLGRLHALYTLHGLKSLTPAILLVAMKDAHSGVRRHAVRLSEEFLNSSPMLFTKLVRMTGDSAYQVGLQLAFSLGESQNKKSIAALAKLLRRADADRDLQYAVLTSVAENAERLATELLADTSYLASVTGRDFLSNLIRDIGSKRETSPTVRLLNATFSRKRDPVVESLVLRAIGSGLRRRGSTLSRLLIAKSVHSATRDRLKFRFRAAAKTAANSRADAKERLAGVKLLANADFAVAAKTLTQLLGPRTPQSIQKAAVKSLSAHQHERIPQILLSRWRSFSPVVRLTVIDESVTRRHRIDALLRAIKSGQIPRREIPLQTRQLLRNHPLDAVRAEARTIFVGGISSKRVKVVASYQKISTLTASQTRGQKVFAKTCAVCHRVGSTGHAVGPDLTSVRNKSPADLLLSILDPNREAQPNFTVYIVVTNGGKITNGIIAAETAGTMTLRRAEGKEDVILRTNIDTLTSSGKSLMPEGLEKDVSPQQMADVIHFIRTLKPARRPAQK